MKWDDYTPNKKYEFKSKAEKMASDIFSDAITQDEVEDYTPQLRGSSLPICILLHAHDLLNPHVRDKPARLDQYSEFGTAAHNLFQKKLMQSKKWGKYLFGDWCCDNVKCEKMVYRYQNRPKDWKTYKCDCGSTGLKYSELEAKYKGVIGVHVDTVLKFPKGKTWVWEYKTTGGFKIRDHDLTFKNKHFHQASSYPVVLKQEFNMDIEKFFIIYVNRDAPQSSKTSQRQHRVFPFQTDTNLVKRRQEQLDRIVKGERLRKIYFKNPTLKNLKALDDTRPCKSKKDYYEPLMGINDKYESGEHCPFIKKGRCSCFKEGLSGAAKELHKKITELKNEL